MGGERMIGDYYHDPENERIVQYMGRGGDPEEPHMWGPEPLCFRDTETGKQFDIFEFEMGVAWVRMNEMEVIAWAAK